MTSTEKSVLKKTMEGLKKSSIVTWKEGNINDWAEWANRMRNTINTSSLIIEGLLEADTEMNASDKPQPHSPTKIPTVKDLLG